MVDQLCESRSRLNVGLDSSILLNPKVWEASGHVSSNDPLIDCKKCKTRYRADQLVEEHMKDPNVSVDGWSFEQLKDYMDKNGVKCTNCGASDFTEIRKFNMMLRTFLGAVDDSATEVFIRPETAQNFVIILRRFREPAEEGTFWHWADWQGL